jgi:hypothetical protein
MRMKTKAYGDRARTVVETEFLRGGYWHPWRDTVEQGVDFDFDWNLKIFELTGDHCDLPGGPRQFESVRDLLMWWENTPKSDPERTNKRIIFIQDMQPRLLELIGVLLDIPPEFFLAHCEEFPTLAVMDEHYANDRGSRYWKVPVPRSYLSPNYHSTVLPDTGVYEVKLGNITRGWLKGVPYRRVTLPSFVSYWAKCYGKDSWTCESLAVCILITGVNFTNGHPLAVLLIDPHSCNIQSLSNLKIWRQTTDFDDYRDLTRVFQHGCDSNSTTSQDKKPIFATMAHAFYNRDRTDDDHLDTATTFARNVIRSVWAADVLRAATLVHDAQHNDHWAQERAPISSPTTSRVPDSEKYRQLMLNRQELRMKKMRLQQIMWSFQCKQPANIHSKFHRSAEHESWTALEEMLDAADSTLGDHMAMFAQRSALAQADAAERQAKSSSQLTKIATFIVPCTFVASIFSMGGDFAAGERLFYIYWTISLPITAILLTWVMVNDPDRDQYLKRLRVWMSRLLGGHKKEGTVAGDVRESKMDRNWVLRKRHQREQHHQEAEP